MIISVEQTKVAGPWCVCFLKTGEKEVPEPLLQVDTISDKREAYHVALSTEVLNRVLREQEVLVCWWKNPLGSPYPINVAEEAKYQLPISPGSTGPDERMLLAYYQGRVAYEELFPPSDQSPEEAAGLHEEDKSEVDTSKIQSYRVREFVESLDGIREDLKAASCSERTMRLALLGPVSPVALARMCLDNAKTGLRTPTAIGFQLVEILKCLIDVGELPGREAWEEHRQKAVSEIEGFLSNLRECFPGDFATKSAFAKYEKQILGLGPS
jgi:hypothetical protein